MQPTTSAMDERVEFRSAMLLYEKPLMATHSSVPQSWQRSSYCPSSGQERKWLNLLNQSRLRNFFTLLEVPKADKYGNHLWDRKSWNLPMPSTLHRAACSLAIRLRFCEKKGHISSVMLMSTIKEKSYFATLERIAKKATKKL